MDVVNKGRNESLSNPNDFHLTHPTACTNTFTGDGDETQQTSANDEVLSPATCQSIDWYSKGDARIVQIGDVQIEVRLVGRKGRKARIAIKAPAGAVFSVDA